MKIKKILGALAVSIILILSSLLMSTASYAATSTFGLQEYRERREDGTQYGYKVLNQTIWKIYKQNNGAIDYDTIVYCLKSEQGFYSETPGKFSEEYNASYDLKDKDSIPSLHSDLTQNYKSILWILDHAYIPSAENSSADRQALLEAALGQYAADTELTDDDIDVIQQLAIWYFTNTDDSKYHLDVGGYPELNNVFQSVKPGKTEYVHIDDVNTYRYADMQDLFTYLVTEAKNPANLTQYDGDISSSPISLDEMKPTAEYDENNSRYIVGPYRINKNNTLPYTLTYAGFTDQDGEEITGYQLLNSNKQPTSMSIEQLIGQEFYISLPESISETVTEVNFRINGSYKTTNMTYWTISNATNTTQPLVEINKTPNDIEGENSVPIEKIPEKIFDLALRKFISQVNDIEINRAPTVDVTPLQKTPIDINNHTAIYNHSKEPVSVKTGDIVTYTIRVYNEGEVDGYVGEITDYLPEELEFINDLVNYPEETRFNASNGWIINPNNSREISTQKLAHSNNAANNAANIIKAFNGTTLDYKDVQVKCIVKEAIRTKKITNLAQITIATDKDGNDITDIDSVPDGGFVLPPDSDLPNYKDPEIASGDPYIPGQEDDDDFEKLIVENFDLALRKFISQIGNSTILGREPEVDVTPLQNGTDTTAIYNHPKQPLGVQVGDIVTYTLRVYNEGEVDGYANEITDYLPEELEFLPDDPINQQYEWEVSADGRIVTTKYLSKEKESASRENLLDAYDGGTTLDYKDVLIRCRVKDSALAGKKITNIAEITEYKDKNGNDVKDIDSEADNLVLPSDQELPGYKDPEIASGDKYIPGQEDDDDFEKIVIKSFDLALRKFITGVGETKILGREPDVDVTPLQNGTGTTANYNHTKKPLSIKLGDIVTYTIRVYNEGDIDGYANEITDYLPEELEFLPDDPINQQYEWEVSEDGRIVTTKYLSKEKESDSRENLIDAYDGGTTLDYKDVQIRCKVKDTTPIGKKLTNLAEITEYKDENGNDVADRDSDSDNLDLPTDEELPSYKDPEIASGDPYIPGQEDDDDFEKVVTIYFDLALRKFITGIDEEEITDRIPQVSMGEDGNLKYEHTKVPLEVENGNIVTYTIRIYNEGLVDGYASQIVDDVPEGLMFLPEDTQNQEYRWEMFKEVSNNSSDNDIFEYAGKKYVKTENPEEADIIRTDYLSKEQEKEPGANLIKALDLGKAIDDENPDHKDVLVRFKVTEPNTSDRIVVNTAEIADDRDENNEPVDDIDSTPGNGEGEDDLDKEYIKVKYFDLSLKKWVSKVILIENGQQTVTDTGHTGEEDPEPIVKVDLHRNKLDQVTVKFEFQIKVTNEGEIAGHANEITDYIPEGLKFVQEDNPAWYPRESLNGRERVGTRALENTLLQPGESASVPIVLTWINGDNMGVKTNIAEISEDDNDDIDSTPDNFIDGEDDQDDAPVMLSIILGKENMFIGLSLLVLTTIAVGVVLIKRYVLK